MSLLTYKYYDTPEGQDIYKKAFVTTKYATLAGFAAATFDVLMFSHPKGIVNTTGRYMFYVGPLVGMATAFTVTANVAQNMRGKNDGLNYFLGGAAAGSILSAWTRSLTIALPAVCVLGGAALVKKAAVDNGWVLVPKVPPSATKTIKSVRHDWTMAKDIEELKTWTTGNK
ncbi:PREDICTED: NADH dehydrogenase [ubiquinone] 1 alpha subcomplex subunit 11 [Papilio xuthus]|uniref:NADH dehydrogenase [ubiquinone] 1 alpha subcomplex subunit 11 n=1 Tax=Papilio xuthus TaxID=66420 RepID=I4DJX7_PAPXU|nr:NADH dehydrogenase [ubiquinone] 1 alpha subcomplex subunit 11 [Papilio xuthus]BAM18217.1 mitochondrial NADH:ubiquinone oxidoreductase B14.7 subunit [Papilio xuthus]